MHYPSPLQRDDLLMDTLNQLLANLTSGNEPQAEAAAVQMIHHGKPAISALVNLARDPDPDTRWWAIRALSEFDDPDASSIFIHALEDKNPEIQACAALSLRLNPNPKAIPQLISLLGNPDQLLSRLAGGALIALGFQATQALINVIESTDNMNQRSRVEAVRALSEIQDPASITTLFNIYQDGSRMMQHWAEQGLNRMGMGMVFFDPN